MKAVSLILSLLNVFVAAVSSESDGEYRHVQLRTHSLQKPYLDQDFQSRWWDFGGTTVVDPANKIRLTYNRQHSTGWLWSRLPIAATNYEIEFEIKLHGPSSGIYGDGMAMWLTTSRAVTGPVFGNADEFQGLGIFFDTYKNGRTGTTFPYVSAMLGDGKTKYDADHDGKNTELAGCSARGIRNAPVSSKARLTYHKDGSLKFELQYKKEDEWTECFNVPGVTLPNVLYLGFTAITGEVSDNHDLIYVNTKNIISSVGDQKAGAGQNKVIPKRKASGTWSGFFLKVLLFFAAIGALFFGYKKYQQKKRENDSYSFNGF